MFLALRAGYLGQALKGGNLTAAWIIEDKFCSLLFTFTIIFIKNTVSTYLQPTKYFNQSQPIRQWSVGGSCDFSTYKINGSGHQPRHFYLGSTKGSCYTVCPINCRVPIHKPQKRYPKKRNKVTVDEYAKSNVNAALCIIYIEAGASKVSLVTLARCTRLYYAYK